MTLVLSNDDVAKARATAARPVEEIDREEAHFDNHGFGLFAAELPDYALQTDTVSPTARRVRETLLDAREPAPLLISDLPDACGFPPLDESATEAEAFVAALRDALDELRAATPDLRTRVGRRIAGTFDLGEVMDEATGISNKVVVDWRQQPKGPCRPNPQDGRYRAEWVRSLRVRPRSISRSGWREVKLKRPHITRKRKRRIALE